MRTSDPHVVRVNRLAQPSASGRGLVYMYFVAFRRRRSHVKYATDDKCVAAFATALRGVLVHDIHTKHFLCRGEKKTAATDRS